MMLEYKPQGMADPDYARIFTQARIIAWQYGFALLGHGSYTRDLDLLMVPWEARAYDKVVPAVINRIAQVTGTTVKGEPSEKPHGRKAYTLFLPDMVRWVDFSVMPCHAAYEVSTASVRTPAVSARTLAGKIERDPSLQLLRDYLERCGVEILQ